MRGTRGFTLIEVLIVVLIVAMLAAIVIPRIYPSGRQAREAELRGNLHMLRTSVALFRAHCGDWPAQLEDLLATTGTGLTGGNGLPILPDTFRGPYFTSSPDGLLPTDPFTGARDWTYEPTTGAVHSASPRISFEGTAYSTW
jgi:prepilin-type N-terminal cleavage/methylation domain-containing protein